MAGTAKRKASAKKAPAPLSADRLCALLSYDRQTGAFAHRISHGRASAGQATGTRRKSGYIEIHVGGRVYKAHRLAWLYTHGRWPADQLDHVNGDPSDNRLANLRECTRAENYQNKARYKTNTSGHVGVTWHGPNRKWLARISLNGRKRCLGYFANIADAGAAYRRAKAELHTFQPSLRGN